MIISSEEDLVPAAEKLLETFPGKKVFAFYGKMGAGKTTFIKVIAKALGSVDVVQSPSFAIINEYKTNTRGSIYHFDFYRIRKTEEVYDIGYEDYIYSGSYCFVEWPEIVEDLLPEDIVKVKISGEGQRVIEF